MIYKITKLNDTPSSDRKWALVDEIERLTGDMYDRKHLITNQEEVLQKALQTIQFVNEFMPQIDTTQIDVLSQGNRKFYFVKMEKPRKARQSVQENGKYNLLRTNVHNRVDQHIYNVNPVTKEITKADFDGRQKEVKIKASSYITLPSLKYHTHSFGTSALEGLPYDNKKLAEEAMAKAGDEYYSEEYDNENPNLLKEELDKETKVNIVSNEARPHNLQEEHIEIDDPENTAYHDSILIQDKPKEVNKAKELANSDVYEVYLGTFNKNVFTWYSVAKYKDATTAYKEFKKYVNTQLQYTDEELKKVWDTGRLDVELRKGNKLLNWVGIYSREVKYLDKKDKEESENKKPKKQKDSLKDSIVTYLDKNIELEPNDKYVALYIYTQNWQPCKVEKVIAKGRDYVEIRDRAENYICAKYHNVTLFQVSNGRLREITVVQSK